MANNETLQALRQHQEKVTRISASIEAFHSTNTPFEVRHGGPSSKSLPLPGQSVIDISDLCHVLTVDVPIACMRVEPGVTMADLFHAAYAHNLMPTVMVGHPEATVGATFAGAGFESGSFRYGGFEDAITRMEVVLGNGVVIDGAASDNEYADLFYGVAGGCETIGIVTMFEVKLVTAAKFVSLTYHLLSSIDEAVMVMDNIVAAEDIWIMTGGGGDAAFNETIPDFVDAIACSPDCVMLMTGQLIDERGDLTLTRFGRRSDPFFAKHIVEVATTAQKRRATGSIVLSKVEAVPLEDYLFRWDRGVFACTSLNKIKKAPANGDAARVVSSPALGARANSPGSSMQLHFGGALPSDSVATGTPILADTLGLWPVWLFPTRVSRSHRFAPGQHLQQGRTVQIPEGKNHLFKFSLFGVGTLKTPADIEAAKKTLTHRVGELKGRVDNDVETYLTEDEFWTRYDRNWYDELRHKYAADCLPAIYDKLRTDGNRSRTAIRKRRSITNIFHVK